MEGAVSIVLTCIQPNFGAAQAAMLCRMVADRGYTKAELALAAKELPFDEVMNSKLRFDNPVIPADFERVIKAHREQVAALRTPQTQSGMFKLLQKYPELERENFKVCGYQPGEDGAPLYRYVSQ